MHKLEGTTLARFELIEEIEPEFIPEVVTEKLKRPERLRGTTYKIKPSNDSGTMYITINDIVMNEGTEYEEIRPFEIFITSKNVEHLQWVSALTRVMSAVFRKGGDISFLVQELGEVYDPLGGYWEGPKLMPSLVAHIGQVLENHLEATRMTTLSTTKLPITPEGPKSSINDFPENATLCKMCKYKAVILKDGCPTCLNCGDSKCG